MGKRSILFGNPNADRWKLKCEGASHRECIVEISGELDAGFFHVLTPMCIDPINLQAFATELESLDRTLSGYATLQSANNQSKISWTLKVLSLGHIESSGCYAINGNELTFSFRTDQTQLAPLLRWVHAALAIYEKADDEE